MSSQTQLSHPSAIAQMSERLAVSESRLLSTLKATAFKGCQNDDQFAALVIVANAYGLNPFLKEIYAFPGKGGEIVPIVSIDGWLRIINSHPQYDGMDEEFCPDGTWCRITVHRKDRSHPVSHTEYLEEVKRGTEPWKQHPRRMLKWKTIIQAARVAFGFGGIYDDEEGPEVGGMKVAVAREVPEIPAQVIEMPKPAKKKAQPETEELI